MPVGNRIGHFRMQAQILCLVEVVVEGVLDGKSGGVRLGFGLSRPLPAPLPLFSGIVERCDFVAHRFNPVEVPGIRRLIHGAHALVRSRCLPDRQVPAPLPR